MVKVQCILDYNDLQLKRLVKVVEVIPEETKKTPAKKTTAKKTNKK